MADEHTDAEGGEDGEGPKKSKPKVALIGMVLFGTIVLIAAGGYFIPPLLAAKKAAKEGKESVEPKEPGKEGGKEEPKKESKGEEHGGKGEGAGGEGKTGNFISMEPIIVNLASDEGKRYLKVTMQLELQRQETVGEATGKMPQLKDMVITVLSSKPADDVLTTDGKFRLKEQLMTRINSILTTGQVKNVFFVEFVIQ